MEAVRGHRSPWLTGGQVSPVVHRCAGKARRILRAPLGRGYRLSIVVASVTIFSWAASLPGRQALDGQGADAAHGEGSDDSDAGG